MLKKVFFTILAVLGIICSLGFYFKIINLRWPFAMKADEAMVLETLPFGIERNNPVPEARHWDLDDKTYYYFNWGLKNTGGYSLELLSTHNNLIKIKAKSPRKGQILIQTLTFPYLLVALPCGNYRYEVVNDAGQPVEIFAPKNPPLRITIFLPRDGGIAKREILRVPTANGKSPALIALESLFNQEEMLDIVNQGILPQNVIFSEADQKWYILLSKGYDILNPEEKELIHSLINKTILSLAANNMVSAEIITDPVLFNFKTKS